MTWSAIATPNGFLQWLNDLADREKKPPTFAALLLEYDLAMDDQRAAAAALSAARARVRRLADALERHEVARAIRGGLTTRGEQQSAAGKVPQ